MKVEKCREGNRGEDREWNAGMRKDERVGRKTGGVKKMREEDRKADWEKEREEGWEE